MINEELEKCCNNRNEDISISLKILSIILTIIIMVISTKFYLVIKDKNQELSSVYDTALLCYWDKRQLEKQLKVRDNNVQR